jgi:hypothetical protein
MNILFGLLFALLIVCLIFLVGCLCMHTYQEYIEFKDKRIKQTSKLKSVK